MIDIQGKYGVNRDIVAFSKEGYILLSLPDRETVEFLRGRLEDKLSKIMKRKLNLKDYHQYVQNDNQHTDIHLEMLLFLHETELHFEVLAKNKEVLELIMGPDIDVQVHPHLRIARPEKPQDNIGFHCDISYGNTCYEMSCIIALTNFNEAGALKILPESHSQPMATSKNRVKSGGMN